MELRNRQPDSIKKPSIINGLAEIIRWPFLVLIRIYQRTISLDHGPLRGLFPYGFCKFHPSCSEYGYEAIKKYGLIRGGAKLTWRVCRCNPWSEGGEDLP